MNEIVLNCDMNRFISYRVYLPASPGPYDGAFKPWFCALDKTND